MLLELGTLPAELRQTSGRLPADLWQTSGLNSLFFMLGGFSSASSGRFLSLYRTFQSADFERLLDLERSLDLDLSLDLLRDLERDLDLLLVLDLLLSPPAFLSFLAADFERDLDFPRPLRRLRVLQLYQQPLLLLRRLRVLRPFRRLYQVLPR